MGGIAVVGEALIDLAHREGNLFEAMPGGSPANVAVGLARLGVPVRMLARLSQDAFGRRLRAHLADSGVDLQHAVAARQPSSLAVVDVDPDGSARYDFRIDGTADWQWEAEELRAGLADVAALHTGSLATAVPPGAAVIRALLGEVRARCTLSYDPNVRPALMGPPTELRPIVESVVSQVDLVKASDEDLRWLYPDRTPEDVSADWLSRGPALVVVTLGRRGCLGIGRTAAMQHRPGRDIEVVDTVGAGDAFTAGLLAGLANRHLLGASARSRLQELGDSTLRDVLDEAILVSALTCARRGAQPPTRDELDRAQSP